MKEKSLAQWFTLLLPIVMNMCIASGFPTFDRTYEDVSLTIGTTAVLSCFINDIGDHKVAWIKAENRDIIAIGDLLVTSDERIGLQHSYVNDWSLVIQQINEDDTGEYMCQVNTEPIIVKKVNLQVLMPPKLIEEKSTLNPSPIAEGTRLSLHCHFDGLPEPKVSWFYHKRKMYDEVETHLKRKIRKHIHGPVIHEGSSLVIENVSRNNSGYFECIANNSVLPAASRKLKVTVEFPPEFQKTNDKLERLVGTDAVFECVIVANPLVNYYWMKNGHILENSIEAMHKSKYDISVNTNSLEYSISNSLIIRNITKDDFGYYDCIAVNKFNTIKTSFELTEIQGSTRKPLNIKISDSKMKIEQNSGKNSKTIPAAKSTGKNSIQSELIYLTFKPDAKYSSSPSTAIHFDKNNLLLTYFLFSQSICFILNCL